MQKVFSVPLNPKLTEEQFYSYLEFLKEYKHLIYDIYFTSRIPPFSQDAMGDIIVSEEDEVNLVKAALYIQKETGIPVSATFNNIQVPPTQKNLDIFISNFKPMYDAGVRIATIPHTHWMATGQIKNAFPELFVKNTILRDVHTATEIVNLAKYGFDYINLDRDLMRDRDTLLRIKKAKEWVKKNLNREIKISLLANEGCLGQCPMMVEHFEFNNNRDTNTPQYFNDPISRVSCPKWDFQDPATPLKTADLPPWKEDWEEFLNDLGIDVFKMHGREAYTRLFETMDIIKRWDNNEEILFDTFEQYTKDNKLEEKPIDVWRKKIKNCKFDCWECQYCDKIYQIKSPLQHSDLVKHVSEAVSLSGTPTVWLDIPGLTSARMQTLINLLAKGVSSYLEIGSGMGATMAAALTDNTLQAYAIDSWRENIQPKNDRITLPDNTKEEFYKNISPYENTNNITIIQQDMFEVNLSEISDEIQMFFYDGPHDTASVKTALEYYFPVLANECVLVFDDANWHGVIEGVDLALEELPAFQSYKKIILGNEEDSNAWWNGVYILVIYKYE